MAEMEGKSYAPRERGTGKENRMFCRRGKLEDHIDYKLKRIPSVDKVGRK